MITMDKVQSNTYWNNLIAQYQEEIISWWAEGYLDSGRATDMWTAGHMAEQQWNYADDKDIQDALIDIEALILEKDGTFTRGYSLAEQERM